MEKDIPIYKGHLKDIVLMSVRIRKHSERWYYLVATNECGRFIVLSFI